MKPGEKGYTLVELLVAISIAAVISAAAGAGIFQTLRNNERNSNHMAAVLELQNADQMISYDARRAQIVTTDNLTHPSFLAMSWIDGYSGDEYQITYTLEDIPGSIFKELRRNQSVNGSPGGAAVVARNINSGPGKTSCNISGGILSLTITAVAGDGATMDSETRIYLIVPRAS